MTRSSSSDPSLETLAEFLGESPSVVALRNQLQTLLRAGSTSRRPPPVLLQGETGTGKGLLARLLHRASPRAQAPMVELSCAAIPETLLEAELFGFERGAFTDARHGKLGLFQLAHRGTLFLDEIGLLSVVLQAKLLSALDERSVRRLGAVRSEQVDVWVIAATNEDLHQAVQTGAFRGDLYHRLAVLGLTLPPLRERGADVSLLAESFLSRACQDYGLPPKSFGDDARGALRSYGWPGNVRELGNAVERAALLADGPVITARHLSLPTARSTPADASDAARTRAADQPLHDPMREHLRDVLTRTSWNISHTALALGISRNTVRARIARYGLGASAVPAAPTEPTVGPTELSPADASTARRGPTVARLWKSRALALLLVRLQEPLDDEVQVHQALRSIADKIHTFGGRIEGVSPTGLVACFGLEPVDEPVVLAAHSAMVIHNAFRRGAMRAANSLPLVMGVHASELLVSDDPEAPTLDADGSRRAWNALDALVDGAAAGTTLATVEAAALLRRRFQLAPRDSRGQSYRVDGLWRVTARGARDALRLAGRTEEMALLEGRMARAARGVGQVVDIVGEAGIGKSRLLLELGNSFAGQRATLLEGRCSPATQGSPFYPILSVLHDACGTVEAESRDAVREKVAAAARLAGVTDGDTVPAVAQLLSGEPVASFDLNLGALKRCFFDAVRQLLIGLSHSAAPLFIAVEDLHWVDSTSEECLASLVEAFGSSPVFFATTYRPEYRPPWRGRSNVTQIALLPLSRDESLQLVHGVDGSGQMADHVIEPILARAEGNPLFLEELTRAALEHRAHHPSPHVPTTIEEVIRFRMSRIRPRALVLLETAAVIGREMSTSLLRHVSELGAEAIEVSLEELRRADFLYESNFRGAEASSVFKHALLQEVAYQRVPEPKRRQIHARVVDVIEQLFGERLIDHVEQLAHHALMAGDQTRAVRYLFQVARKAAARSALAEAVMRLERAIDIVQQGRESPNRDREELELLAALGIVLRAGRGSGAPETERVFARARVLCRRLGDVAQLGPVLVGQWFTHLMHAQYRAARDQSDELCDLAERAGDALLGVFAHRAVGMTALYEGDFAGARRHLEESAALFDVERHHARAVREYGGDPYPSCLAYLGRTLWCLGYPDQAVARNHDAVRHARERGGPLDIAAALTMLTSVYELRRDSDETREGTDRALAYARDHGIGYWIARNALLKSFLDARSAAASERDANIAGIRRTLDEYRATGTALGISWFLALLGRLYGDCGQPLLGISVLDDAISHARETGEHYHEAEILALRGDLLSMSGGPPEVAEVPFRAGLDVARRQRAKGWELRVATGLARLLRVQGRAGEARALLAPVYAWFTEGFDTQDLRDARAELRALGLARDGGGSTDG